VRKEREEPLAASFGDEIHSDVWGPASIETIHHRKYYASFTDDSTRWSHVKLLHGKDDTFDAYKEFEAWVGSRYPHAHRGEMMEEGLAIFRSLITDKVSSFAGKYYSYNNIEMFPKPKQNPFPLFIGGHNLNRVERAPVDVSQ